MKPFGIVKVPPEPVRPSAHTCRGLTGFCRGEAPVEWGLCPACGGRLAALRGGTAVLELSANGTRRIEPEGERPPPKKKNVRNLSGVKMFRCLTPLCRRFTVNAGKICTSCLDRVAANERVLRCR